MIGDPVEPESILAHEAHGDLDGAGDLILGELALVEIALEGEADHKSVAPTAAAVGGAPGMPGDPVERDNIMAGAIGEDEGVVGDFGGAVFDPAQRAGGRSVAAVEDDALGTQRAAFVGGGVGDLLIGAARGSGGDDVGGQVGLVGIDAGGDRPEGHGEGIEDVVEGRALGDRETVLKMPAGDVTGGAIHAGRRVSKARSTLEIHDQTVQQVRGRDDAVDRRGHERAGGEAEGDGGGEFAERAHHLQGRAVSLGEKLDLFAGHEAEDEVRESERGNGQLGVGRDDSGGRRVDHGESRDRVEDDSFGGEETFGSGHALPRMSKPLTSPRSRPASHR